MRVYAYPQREECDAMEQKSDIFDMRHALRHKLLQGELPQAKQAGYIAQCVDTQSQKGQVVVRPVLLQTGSRTPFFFLHGAWTGNVSFCFSLVHSLGPIHTFYLLNP